MKLSAEDYDQITVLTIEGDVTADEIDQVRKAATDKMAHDVRDFVIDLTAVEFVDSTGLETLLWLQEQCGEKLGQVRLAGASETVHKIFDITRLASRFDCHDEVESALKSLR